MMLRSVSPALGALALVCAVPAGGGPVYADPILPAPQVDAAGYLKFRGGPTLGTWNGGESVATPQAFGLPSTDQGSAGEVSGMRVKPAVTGATAVPLSALFGDAGRSALFGIRCDAALTSDGRVLTGSGTDNTGPINAMMTAFRDAQLPPGYCRVRGQLTIPAGRTLRGSSNVGTVLVVGSDFNMSASGVVRFSGPGAVNTSGVRLLDIGIDFAQPDTGTRSQLTAYPPAIDAKGSRGGWTIDRVRVAHATKTLDMKGEQGQSKIGLLETSFFGMGLDIDGARDSINIGTLRFWPYGFTANQYQVLLDGDTTINGGQGMVGLSAGRLDGLVIDSFFSIFYPKAMRFYYSPGYGGDAAFAGITTATVNKMQLDTTGGLVCEWCTLSIASSYINIGYAGYTALTMHGGSVNIGQVEVAQFGALGNRGQAAPATETPLVSVDNLNTDATLTISGMTASQGAVDRTLLAVASTNAAFNQPVVQIADLAVRKDPTKAYTKPVFDLGGATGNILGVQINNLTSGSGVLFRVPNDNPLTIGSAATGGWTNVAPRVSSVRYNLNSGWKDGSITLPLGGVFAGANITAGGALVGGSGLYTGSAVSPTRVIDASQNVKAAMFGANGATPVGKCTLPAALATDGSATNAQIATMANAIKTCLNVIGLAQ